jgi:DNA adenine methylase
MRNIHTKMKPFLKWVGGKTQIINPLMEKFPNSIKNYHEIFVGGGSVIFALLDNIEKGITKVEGDIYAYDFNANLIRLYNDIKTNPESVHKSLDKIDKEYDKIEIMNGERKPKTKEEAMVSKESLYYWYRNYYNHLDPSTEKSAIFIFLNKTCFRGMYREGPNGFNVPYGNYKNVNFPSKTELLDISIKLQKVIFVNCSFEESIIKASEGDFVYLDPPYVPETKTSFVSYTSKGFDMHSDLFKMIHQLNDKGIKFCMSNSNTEFVTKNFNGYKIEEIVVRRAINSKSPGSKSKEVFVSN